MKLYLSLRRHPSQLVIKVLKVSYNMSTSPRISESDSTGDPLWTALHKIERIGGPDTIVNAI
jgi:hypothetical protein